MSGRIAHARGSLSSPLAVSTREVIPAVSRTFIGRGDRPAYFVEQRGEGVTKLVDALGLRSPRRNAE